MSRFLAYWTTSALTWTDAFGPEALRVFRGLSAVHADGWGEALSDSTGSLTAHHEARRLLDSTAALDSRGVAGILYARFASRGTPALVDVQPFVAGDRAFAHNGALNPVAAVRALLDDDERGRLRGTTDSELFFARVARELDLLDHSRLDPKTLAEGVARAVAAVRDVSPEACLNAALLSGGRLVVVHSPGTVAPPLAAFAHRGFAPDSLPPGHDASYNVLATTVTDDGVRLVATSGIDRAGWSPLPVDTVTVIAEEGPTVARL